eukprot:1441906-Amphidinium_carterae.1
MEDKPPDGARPGSGDAREVYYVPDGAVRDAYGGPAMQPLPEDWPGPIKWPGDPRPPAPSPQGSSFLSPLATKSLEDHPASHGGQ